MRFIAAILILLCYARLLEAQGTRMKIELTDGTTVTYPVDSVAGMHFTETDTFPHYTVMRVYAYVQLHLIFVRFQADRVDSMKFVQDNSRLSLYGSELGDYDDFELIGSYGPGEEAQIDSITFVSHQIDTTVTTVVDSWNFENCNGDKYLRSLFGIWNDSTIALVKPFRKLTIDSQYQVIHDSMFCPEIDAEVFSANAEFTKFLFVSSREFDVSIGSLYQYEPGVGLTRIIGEDSNISIAHYYNEDTIVYYTYGSYSDSNTNPIDAGYYFYDLINKQKTFILPYMRLDGPKMINGFDVSPDRKKLLISSDDRSPKYIMEFDLMMKEIDTMKVNLPWGYLWTRYNHDGSKIIYSAYPFGSLGHYVNTYYSNTVGVIDRETLSHTLVPTPLVNELEWITLWPDWSPDGKSIIYVTSPLSAPPYPSMYHPHICIKKLD